MGGEEHFCGGVELAYLRSMTIQADFKKLSFSCVAPVKPYTESPPHPLEPYLREDFWEKEYIPSPVKAAVSMSILSMVLLLSSNAKMKFTSSAL